MYPCEKLDKAAEQFYRAAAKLCNGAEQLVKLQRSSGKLQRS